MIKKKGQAAMEFLMTYGWAILVVLGAITALAYFGVLSPSKFYPDSCILPTSSGLGCSDFVLYPDSAHLLLVNGRGMVINIHSISFDSCSQNFSIDLNDGEMKLFNISSCDFGNKGNKVKETFEFSYNFEGSSLSKTSTGSITAQIN